MPAMASPTISPKPPHVMTISRAIAFVIDLD